MHAMATRRRARRHGHANSAARTCGCAVGGRYQCVRSPGAVAEQVVAAGCVVPPMIGMYAILARFAKRHRPVSCRRRSPASYWYQSPTHRRTTRTLGWPRATRSAESSSATTVTPPLGQRTAHCRNGPAAPGPAKAISNAPISTRG